MPQEISPYDTTRAAAFELWMQAPNPMVTFFKTLNVTMGFGACIHRSKAAALVVSKGEISCGIDVMIDWFNKDVGV